MGSTVRIDAQTHRMLRRLSGERKRPMSAVVAEAVQQMWRRHRLLEINASFAALREDPDAWAEELDERKLWEQTLADGLDDE